MEHYVTIFDSKFVLAGIALHDSLSRFCRPFTLWVVALDREVEEQLTKLALDDLRVVPLSELETPALLAVKDGRTRGEYCWTLTPFLPTLIFDRAPEAQRVTYLDADLYFFGPAAPLFAELDASGKDVLITEHAYAPRYDRSATSGRFCVQFNVFTRTAAARRVLEWWQARCLEWCFARYERGLFGDQKYLDQWPALFGDVVHILRAVDLTLAPWNVDHLNPDGKKRPAFYHFQGFRILGADHVKLYHGYRVGAANRWIYRDYLDAIASAARRMLELGYPVPTMPEHAQRFRTVKYALMRLTGYMRFARLFP